MKRVCHRFRGPLLLTLSLLLSEAILQLLSHRVFAVQRILVPSQLSPWIDDSVLGARRNPLWHDHDAHGFRNAKVLGQAEIVTVGDSHTYGVGIERSRAWPFLIGVGTGKTSYSMAVGGWGPAQGYLLFDEVLALRPSRVIYALYFGNDLYNAFRLVSGRPELREFIPPSLVDTTAALESKLPMFAKLFHLYSTLHGQHQQDRKTDQQDSADRRADTRALWQLRTFLSRHSKLYGLARAVKNAVAGSGGARTPAVLSRDIDQALKRITEDQRPYISVYRHSAWKTLLTPAYRNVAIDDADPRIRVGIEATKLIFAAMDSLCLAQGAHFLVLLLPTKETVVASRMRGEAMSAPLDSLVRNEKRVHDELVAWLDGSRIEYLDALPALRLSVAQPYFTDADGHPNEVGHRVIAEAVIQRLRTHK